MTILVPESRELDLFAAMLEAEGAYALRCPLVQILDLEDTAHVEIWIDQLIAGRFDDVIWLTGEGLRRLLPIVGHTGRRDAFVGALSRVRTIIRGPKPARALRELGLSPGITAAIPTSQGVLDALAIENLERRAIGVQLYPGDGGVPLVTALRERGANVFPVTPYRYAAQTDSDHVVDAIKGIIAARIGMIAFTSSSQIERLLAVARDAGLEDVLMTALRHLPVAAIGPVVEQTLRRQGIAHIVRPETSFHLKPLVRAIVAAWTVRP